MSWDGVEKRTVPERCIYHENRMVAIEKRQVEIYKSMFGQNGDPSDGYVWKITQAHKFIQDVTRLAWIAVPIGVAGALAALWQVFVAAVKTGVIK